MPIKLGIVGVGKIARDQHLPVIAASDEFQLVAAASRNAQVEGVPNFRSLADMLAATPGVEAVALCTPPVGRGDDAHLALARNVHVMLEKPPASTLSEAEALVAAAKESGASLFASWHSRHAAAVEAARSWLSDRRVQRAHVAWMEDVRVWHPGQDWILEPGGLGVFDPAINALSILTYVLPEPFALRSGRLAFPVNRQAPISGQLRFEDRRGARIDADLDFLHEGEQRWDIEVETDTGTLRLTAGGARMTVDGQPVTRDLAPAALHGEYEGVYRRFADLIRRGASDTDLAPLRHVADAFMLCERATAPPFQF